MADFAAVQLASGIVHINLDYVLKIEVGMDSKEPTVVRLTNGEVLKLAHAEGTHLISQLNRCCRDAPPDL